MATVQLSVKFNRVGLNYLAERKYIAMIYIMCDCEGTYDQRIILNLIIGIILLVLGNTKYKDNQNAMICLNIVGGYYTLILCWNVYLKYSD